ncbi:hypothetical protein PHAVU_004G081500 [Phaseolus vulgaris]
MTEANFGWLIRSVHRWSASMIVLMMILHVFRVYLTGGFKKPREIIIFFSLLYGIYTSIFMYDTFYSIPSSNIIAFIKGFNLVLKNGYILVQICHFTDTHVFFLSSLNTSQMVNFYAWIVKGIDCDITNVL